LNLIFEVNYAAFAVFASLLISEMMGSVLLLLFWKEARSKVLGYVVPIWEVTGTFGAFWVVTGDFAYPSLLVPVASIFAPLLTMFLIFFVARNASIAFGEFIAKRRWLDEAKLYRMYAISTIILGLTVLVLLSSLVSGAGVDLAKGTFSVGAWISSPGSLLFVVGTLLIGVGVAPVFYSLSPLRRIVLPVTAAGIAVSVLSYYLYSPSSLSAWMLVPVALTLAAGALFMADRTASIVSNKAISLAVLGAAVFSLQFLIYPSVLGGAISIDAVTTSGPMAHAYLVITAVGGVMLAIMLGFYMSVASHSKGSPLGSSN
jgi:cytochrome d ubiquinol oxidase subunit II